MHPMVFERFCSIIQGLNNLVRRIELLLFNMKLLDVHNVLRTIVFRQSTYTVTLPPNKVARRRTNSDVISRYKQLPLLSHKQRTDFHSFIKLLNYFYICCMLQDSYIWGMNIFHHKLGICIVCQTELLYIDIIE